MHPADDLDLAALGHFLEDGVARHDAPPANVDAGGRVDNIGVVALAVLGHGVFVVRFRPPATTAQLGVSTRYWPDASVVRRLSSVRVASLPRR